MRGDQLVAARRRLRPAHHRGAVGDALLRSRLADGRRSSGGHRGLRRRALRRAGAAAGVDRHRAGAAARARRATTAGATSSTSSRARDDRHLDFAGRGAYQGITRDHYVELELPDDAPRSGPLWLIGAGLGASDRQLDQRRASRRARTRRRAGLSLQVADARRPLPRGARGPRLPVGQGQDGAARSRRRVPASERAAAPAPRHESRDLLGSPRLGGRAARRARRRRAASTLASADLRYRGYSVTEQHDAQLARAAALRARPARRRAGSTSRAITRASATCASCWRGVDDRYVIMNAGDELALRVRRGARRRPPAWSATSS